MAVVTLAIVEPRDGQRFRGAEASSVRLRGELRSTGHGTLYYRWYSSLAGALNASSDNPFDFTKPLPVGSHILTFTTKDKQGDALADIQAVQDAGMTGGPPEPGVESPCVVHAFIAAIVEPAPNATLNRASSTLMAVAPSQWGRRIGTSNVYEQNPDYHAVNKIRYRWRFQPSGAPEGSSGGDLVPSAEQLTFAPHPTDSGLMIVRYTGPLPAGLGTGNYTLALRVEELVQGQSGPTFGDETTPRAVVLT
jgi:hypothetical protein